MAARQKARRIAITGANRGLGLELTRQWLEAGHAVAACARRPEAADELRALEDEHGERLSLHACDVGDAASVASAAASIGGLWDGLDLLVNNAGVGGDRATFPELDFAEMARVYEVNTLGPLRVTAGLLPLLERGDAAAVVLVTSRMGSVADNESGGSYAYRLSKAALNMAGHNLSLDLRERRIACYLIHPGWVRTAMGGSSAPLSTSEAVRKMIATIDRLERAQSGGFFDFEGRELPW